MRRKNGEPACLPGYCARSRTTSEGSLSSRSPRKPADVAGHHWSIRQIRIERRVWAASSVRCGGSVVHRQTPARSSPYSAAGGRGREVSLWCSRSRPSRRSGERLPRSSGPEGAKIGPAAGGIGITADDELLLPDALQLQPIFGASSDVRRVGTLAMRPSQPARQASANRRGASFRQASVCCNAGLDWIVLVSRPRRSTNGRSVNPARRVEEVEPQ